jgi:hypothetical protein
VFENRVLIRIFGHTRDEVKGEWRKLHNDELHNFYSSPNVIRQIKYRRMRWKGHVARVGEERPKERIHLKGKGVDGRMGSEWIFERLVGSVEWIKLS